MNKYHIIAWLDDLQISAQLAKISTTHSYKLQFCDSISQISYISEPIAMIIDLNSTSEADLKKILALKQNLKITYIGYCQEINGSLRNYFKKMGCEVVVKRYELLKNLGPIIKKIFNAC